MRQDLHSPNIFDAEIKSARLSHARHVLSGHEAVTANGPIVNFYDPNGANRDITLPENNEGLFYVIANIGIGFNLLVKDAAGTLQATVAPSQTLQIWSSEGEWQGTKATTDLDVFTNTVDGLVPAPNSAVPGSLFLRDDGQWAQVQVVGIVDAFKYMSDGTNIAVGAGPDTFTFRSSTGKIGLTVTNNEAVFGDNLNLTVNEAAVNHDLLLNFVANEHIDHSTVSITGGTGLTGGGAITSSQAISFNPGGLSTVTPALTDFVVWHAASGGNGRKTLFSTLNGVLDHNALANYVADQHVAHSGVSIIAGTGLSGGGTIASSRTLNLNITGLTADTIATADELAFYDTSGADHNKITFGNLTASIDHNSLLNYVADQHVAHSGVTLTAGAGLTGGGTIAASRTFDVGAGTGITVNTNDVALAAIATQRIMANISGGNAAPSANTLTGILDNIIGSTRGMLLVRGSAAWQALGLGANNTFLKSDGTDALWGTPAGGGTVTSVVAHGVTITTTGTVPPVLGVVNHSLAVSAAGSALTISLKDAAGNDPSAASPVNAFLRHATATTGSLEQLTVTAATSLVLSSGSTLGVQSSRAFRIWVVLFKDGATARLAAINCSTFTASPPNALSIFALNQSRLASAVSEGGAGGADSAGVFYSNATITDKAFVVLGYIEWNTSGITAGTWTTTNLLYVQSHYMGSPLPGDELWSEYVSTTTSFSTTSSSFQTTNLSKAITMKSAANFISLETNGSFFTGNATATSAHVAIFRDATQLQAFTSALGASGVQAGEAAMFWLDNPNSLSSITYSVKLKNDDGVTTCRYPSNVGSDSANLKIKEIVT